MVTVNSGLPELDELLRKRKRRNWAVAGVLAAFVVIVYLVSLVRMGGG